MTPKLIPSILLAGLLIGVILLQMPFAQAQSAGRISETVYIPVGQTIVFRYIVPDNTPALSPEEEALFAQIVMSECGNTEPDAGVAAVAECLLNAMQRDKLSVAEAAERYVYTTARLEPSIRVKAICQAVVRGDIKVLDDPDARWFYAPQYAISAYHESLELVTVIGGHRFFK